MKIDKSSRHSKITGDFAEYLVLYWLSKHKFECVHVDHTGIDIIAKNPNNNELIGISVKSRSRNEGKEETSLRIDNDNFDKVNQACKDFKCSPYFAIVIDGKDKIRIFILSMDELRKLYPRKKNSISWSMRKKRLEEYYSNNKINIIELDYKVFN